MPLRGESAGSQLLGVVILSRHGVRAPINDPSNYGPSRLWPTWPVVHYGDLTTHGEDLARRFGAFYRRYVIGAGLVSAPKCAAWGDQLYIYADREERTLRTGEAISAGIAPQCGYSVHASSGPNDPIFHPPSKPRKRVVNAPELSGAYRGSLGELRRVLGCCALDGPQPLLVASTVAEIFQLEYAQGITVAWDRGGKDPRKFLADVAPFHVLDYTLNERSPSVAREAGSNLLAHIGATLTQIAGRGAARFTHDYRPPAGSKLVVLVGHDTNQANLGGLLGLGWSLPGFERNDMPPAASLAFELRRCALRDVCVRLRYRSETLDFMRVAGYTLPAARAVGPAQIVETDVPIPGCPGDCTLTRFSALVKQKADPKFVRL